MGDQDERGFTIVELVVVVTIIGVLSAIVLPGFNKAQIHAKEVAITTMAQSIQMGIETYYIDTGSYPDQSSIESLLTELVENRDLSSHPKNPFSNSEFSSTDSSGKLVYQYNSTDAAYTLTAYGQGNSAVLSTLSSL